MKIRSVRPEFFTDAKMARLSHSARLLYIGLWCLADDDGRGRLLPKHIEGELFPYEKIDFLGLWHELESIRRVRTYQTDGEQYFVIPKFTEYQKPNRKYDSKLPEPPGEDNGTLFDSETAGATQRVEPAPSHAGEGEGEGEGEGVLAVAPRERDPVWDILVTLFGEPSNDNTRGKRNRVVKLLKQSGASVVDIRTRHRAWRNRFPDATITDTGLANQWDTLGRPARKDGTEWTSGGVAKKLDPEVCPHRAVNDEGLCLACETVDVL